MEIRRNRLFVEIDYVWKSAETLICGNMFVSDETSINQLFYIVQIKSRVEAPDSPSGTALSPLFYLSLLEFAFFGGWLRKNIDLCILRSVTVRVRVAVCCILRIVIGCVAVS